jgi:hypothetical protein
MGDIEDAEEADERPFARERRHVYIGAVMRHAIESGKIVGQCYRLTGPEGLGKYAVRAIHLNNNDLWSIFDV